MANKEKSKNRMLCPQCKGQLIRLGDEYECEECGARYKKEPHKENRKKKEAQNWKEPHRHEYERHTRKSAAKSRRKHEKSSRHAFAMADLPYMLEELSTLSIAGIIAIVLVVVAAVIATPVLAKSQSEDTETEESAEDSEPKEIQEAPEPAPVILPPKEPEKLPSEDGRVHTLADIPETAIDRMASFNTSDLKARFAVKDYAIDLIREQIDSRYPVLVPKDDDITGPHPLSWWITPPTPSANEMPVAAADVYFDRILAEKAYLLQDNENNPDKGTLKILYEVMYSVTLPYEVDPGSTNVIEDSVYLSYSYPVNLADKEHFLEDYAKFSFDDKEYVDTDADNWELKHISNNDSGAVLLDEDIVARG